MRSPVYALTMDGWEVAHFALDGARRASPLSGRDAFYEECCEDALMPVGLRGEKNRTP